MIVSSECGVTMETNRDSEAFLTPQGYLQGRAQRMESPRGGLVVTSCRSGAQLAERVVERYEALLREGGEQRGVPHLAGVDFQFSDGETCVRLEADVSGQDVFLFQALYDPVSRRSVDQNYVAFLAGVRACREWGANFVTGVLPYLAYARQDKPTRFEREPTTAELMADLSIEAGIDRLVVWDPHTGRIHGFYGSVPVNGLSSLSLFTEVFGRFRGRDEVIAVAPDAGAAKFIMHFARALNVSSAVASKYRPRPEEAEVSEIMGDFGGKRIGIVLDDMINTGGTVEATVTELIEEKGIEEIYLGVSHNLCSERALQRLSKLYAGGSLREAVVTDSVPQTEAFRALPFLSVERIADPISRVINRIHYNRSVDDIGSRPVVGEV